MDDIGKVVKEVGDQINKLPQTIVSGAAANATQHHTKTFNEHTYDAVNTPDTIEKGELHWSSTATNRDKPEVVGKSVGEFVSPDKAEEAAIKNAETILMTQSELVILLISADPEGGSVDIQNMQRKVERQVQQQLGEAAMKRFRFDMHLSVGPDELIDLIGKVKPDILHFFGHSGTDGIGLCDPDHSNQFRVVSADNLMPTLSLPEAKTIKLLLLTGCSNESVAEDLAKKSEVDYVIGTTAEISNEQAISFAAQFYTLLVQSKTIWESYNSGQAQLAMLNLARAFHVKSKRTKEEDEAQQNVNSILWRS